MKPNLKLGGERGQYVTQAELHMSPPGSGIGGYWLGFPGGIGGYWSGYWWVLVGIALGLGVLGGIGASLTRWVISLFAMS